MLGAEFLSTDRIKQLVQLNNRLVGLADSLRRRSGSDRNRDLATRYNILRADVRQLVNDPDFDRTVPPAWCFEPFPLIPLAFLVVSLGIVPAYFLLESKQFWGVVIIALGLVALGLFEIYLLLPASTIEQVQDRTKMLHQYLEDYIALNPDLASQILTKDEQKLKRQLVDLQSRHLGLADLLTATTHKLEHCQERLAGLKTPSRYEVPQQVLNKLDPLERRRLLEAVQAYRVNAWTPAAAVCGMILEGRLQRLCKENGIRSGGIGEMIRRLGGAGLLKGYYQNLAQVGEFFRHRATHPTSEEFDREKTTLVLTSLIILIRDLF